MKIIAANESGFCFGVERAVNLAMAAAAEHGRVFTYGELMHNEDAVDDLKEKGVLPVDSVEGLKAGDVLVIRSHGAPPEIYKLCEAMKIVVVDATCPFVRRIHQVVLNEYKKRHTIIIAGEKKHPEVIGINGWCEDSAYFVKTADELKALPDGFKNVCLVAQTTFSVEAYKAIAEEMKRRFCDVDVFNTICDVTVKRQEEAERLSKICDAMIVIGGSNSSNTKKLADICKKHGKKVQSIAKPCQLVLEKFDCNDIIGVVAGASTPHRMIREVITRMSEMEKTMAECPKEQVSEVKAEDTATVTEPTAAEPAASTEPIVTEPDQAQADTAESSFAEAFEKTLVRIRNGQLIKGSVVQIVDGEVCVNIGYKSDGFIPRSEFSHDDTVDPAEMLKIGDVIEVEVLKVNDGEGNVLLSRKNVENKRLWDRLIQDPEAENKIYDGIGKEVVKGGLIATIDGVRAFVPASYLSTKYVESIQDFVKKPLKLKIIEIDRSRKRIVASHKQVLMEEAEQAKKEKFETLKAGMKVTGTVRRLTNYGAFVDIGGVDGLIHVTDVAWGRVKNPSDVLRAGQEVELLVLNVDSQKGRISLGYKQLQPKPWTMAAEKYPVGSIVEGKVVRIVDFGAFVALEPTIDGLIHISQVGARRVQKVEDELNVGDMVRCKVLEVNPEAKRISLSRRDVILEENPELVAELAKEREERAKMARERADRRAQIEQQKQQQPSAPRERTAPEHRERRERPSSEPRNNEQRPERERRPRREDADYELPPVEQATTSLASLFSGFDAGEDE